MTTSTGNRPPAGVQHQPAPGRLQTRTKRLVEGLLADFQPTHWRTCFALCTGNSFRNQIGRDLRVMGGWEEMENIWVALRAVLPQLRLRGFLEYGLDDRTTRCMLLRRRWGGITRSLWSSTLDVYWFQQPGACRAAWNHIRSPAMALDDMDTLCQLLENALVGEPLRPDYQG